MIFIYLSHIINKQKKITMKKVLLFAVVLGSVALTSCTKDYTCTYEFFGEETVIKYEGLNSDEADAAETGCNLLGGKFE